MNKLYSSLITILLTLICSLPPLSCSIKKPENGGTGNGLNAEIITIGDEILIGQIVDTNSAWIAEQFNLHGIEVFQIKSVHDDPLQIKQAIKKAEGNADLIVLTGGLGPTIDDITKKVLCDYFNTKLVFNEPAYQNIKKLIEKRGIAMNRHNRGQAMVPESCTVLPNIVGTAPGLWFEKDGIILVSLPGVPYEMKHIMTNEVIPRLQKNDKIKAIFHKTVLTQGLVESILSEQLEQWEAGLPKNIKLAYLPGLTGVRLRLSARGEDVNILQGQVETEIEKLKTIIPEYIFGYDNETIAEVVLRELSISGQSLAVAEEYTGGYISYLITSIPGNSRYYKGGVTISAKELQKKFTGQSQKLPEVNEPAGGKIVSEMARNIREELGADYAIATIGETDPDNDNAPAGTVWISVAGPHKIVTEKIVFGNNRERNIIMSGQTALQILRRMIISD